MNRVDQPPKASRRITMLRNWPRPQPGTRLLRAGSRVPYSSIRRISTPSTR